MGGLAREEAEGRFVGLEYCERFPAERRVCLLPQRTEELLPRRKDSYVHLFQVSSEAAAKAVTEIAIAGQL
jgi:hypothetical protein